LQHGTRSLDRGEFVDEVLVAVSWTDALTIAQRRPLQVAVVDFDESTRRQTWLVDDCSCALTPRSSPWHSSQT